MNNITEQLKTLRFELSDSQKNDIIIKLQQKVLIQKKEYKIIKLLMVAASVVGLLFIVWVYKDSSTFSLDALLGLNDSDLNIIDIQGSFNTILNNI